MQSGGWSCPHESLGICNLIKKACDPGDRGCVLFAKAKFASNESASNEAFEKRMERKMKRLEQGSDIFEDDSRQ